MRSPRRERQVRHDVMAHVYAYGEVCPKAKGIIHLGATSCYVGDNTDVIVMREGLRLIRTKLLTVMDKLASFALQYKDLPCLAYTISSPRSSPRSASAPRCGSTSCSSTLKSWSTESILCSCSGPKVQPEPRLLYGAL